MDFQLPPSPPAASPIPEIDFRAALNDEQFKAVTAPPGPLLVLAGAGAGKTRTLTYRVAYLLSQGIRPGEILLLTFTNKAAKEMLHRVHKLTGSEPTRFWGGTFHSLGNRALRLYGEAIKLRKNFTILDVDESETLLKETVEAEDKLFFKEKTNPRPGAIFNVLSLIRNTQLSLSDIVTKYFPQYGGIQHCFSDFLTEYTTRKREQNVVDYDDLLELWLKLLNEAPGLADYFSNRFRHLLVDEYQDTNLLQAQIVDKLAPHHRIMAVGDDAQCIYSWRGANFENLMSFPERHEGTVIHRIETNYRSTPEILAFANDVFKAQSKGYRFYKKLRAARGHAQKPAVIQAMDDREQAEFIVKRIRSLIENDGVSPSEIAILYRSHFTALEMQFTLARHGIPYHITSGVKFFERQHVRDLIALISFVYNPNNTLAWQRFANLLPKVGEKGAKKIYVATLDHARLTQRNFIDALTDDEVKRKVPKDAKSDWTNFCASLAQIAETIDRGRPADAIQVAIDGWYGDYMKGKYADYIDRLEELKGLVGFASQSPIIQEFLTQVALLNGETSDRQIDPDTETIRLTTVHQAKGLEYDIVFVIGVTEGQFPTSRSVEAGDVEEERRLFYVAATRAKNELYISYPKVSSRPGPGGMLLQPSRFLLELSSELYDELRIKRNWSL